MFACTLSQYQRKRYFDCAQYDELVVILNTVKNLKTHPRFPAVAKIYVLGFLKCFCISLAKYQAIKMPRAAPAMTSSGK